MRKVIVVAVREYLAAVKTKAFIISLLAMPILMVASILVQVVMLGKVDTKDKRIAILDRSGVLFDEIAAAAREWNTTGIFEGEGDQRKQVKPRYVIEQVTNAPDDPAKADFELSERVREKELLAFVVIGPDVVEPAEDSARASVRYHSNSPTYDTLQKWLRRPINKRVQQLRLEAAHLDRDVVAKAMEYTRVQNLGLVTLDEEGNIIEAQETNEMANIFVPLSMMMLMFMVVMVGGPPLMQSVLEEKMQRIAEVLLASVAPFELMLGKLIGMVGVSLTIAILYLVGAYVAIHQAGYGQFFPGHVIGWFVLYQALAVLMFGSLFIAVGAAVSDIKESQSMVTPIMIVVVSPMFVWLPVVKEPSSTLATVLSLIPPLTPTLMVLRQSVPPGIPLWQPLLGVLLVLLTTVACVFCAGRIFRVGILMQGKGAKVGEMLRWIVRG